MGHALALDTHAYVKKLEKAGFNEKQAEAQVEALAEIVDENLATKLDLKELEQAIKELENNLKRDLKELELRFETKIAEAKADIIKWNVGAVFTAVGLFATIMKLIG